MTSSHDAAASASNPGKFLKPDLRLLICLLILGLSLSLAVGGTALASYPDPTAFQPSAAEVQEARESASEDLTDAELAEELPHRDLGRSEALELMQGVFGSLLEAPAGIFDDLHIEKFLTDNAAVISADDQPAVPGEDPGQEAGATGSLLLESTVPLRTEGATGTETVDLSLQGDGGDLHPANPLVDVSIPSELGEGIELPGAGVTIDVEGVPAMRSPSTIEGTVAFYPNIALDTDLAVSPTPSGVETFTHLRTPDAPVSQTFTLDLPDGADLQANEFGGAEATWEGEPLLSVSPPTAFDANGDPVPVALNVDGHALVVTAEPDASTAYPVVVDPTIQDAYNWYYDGHPGWTSYRTPQNVFGNFFQEPSTGCSTYCYLKLAAAPGGYAQNSQTYWQYAVPRFFQDYETEKVRPTSWIQSYSVGSITFTGGGEYTANPGALFAVSDQNGAWRTANLYPPNISGGYGINLNGDHSGKLASFGLFTGAPQGIFIERYLLTGESQIVLGDDDLPVFGSIVNPTKWVNTQPAPFDVTISDTGLGVHWLEVKTAAGAKLGATSINNNCVGNAKKPCPRTWKGAQAGNTVYYNPTSLPQGTNSLKLEAIDSVANSSTASFQVKVDHSAPELLPLTGTATEQVSLGKTLPQYKVKFEAKDGTTANPRSGVASAEIKVDSKQVKSWSPGCATQNCTLSGEWTLNSSEYSVGQHAIEVTATDAVGLKSATKTLLIDIQRDTSAPTMVAGGALVSGPQGWIQQKSYGIGAQVDDPKGYGATKLELLIDGKQASLQTQSCPSGGCSLVREFTLKALNYKGGTHTVKLLAADGAGNTSSKVWTINIDPQGQVSAAEVTDTLEAVEKTTEAQPVASTEEFLEPEIIAAGDNPGFKSSGDGFESIGVTVDATVGEVPAEGFTLEGNDGLINVTPVGSAGESKTDLAGDASAVVGANLKTGVDTVVRPEYNGIMTFQDIREATSPQTFSWEVHMGAEQTLQSIDDEHAEVAYEDGTTAFLITAEQAHDATGNAVTTKLSVSGAILTLTVQHQVTGIVYPVMAGQYYETSYSPPTVYEIPVYEGPPVPQEEEESEAAEEAASAAEPLTQQEFDDATGWLLGGGGHRNQSKPVTLKQAKRIFRKHRIRPDIPAPSLNLVGGPGGNGSGGWEKVLDVGGHACSAMVCDIWNVKYANETNFAMVRTGSNSNHAEYTSISGPVHCGGDVNFWWSLNLLVDTASAGARGSTLVKKGSGEHLTFWCKFHLDIFFVPELPFPEHFDSDTVLITQVFANGYQHTFTQNWNTWINTL